MTVTGDRVVEHGLSTVGWDDEGVPAQTWDIVRDGVHVGYQLDRAMAAERGETSNGCAYADTPVHAPVQRMPNVSLAADPDGPDLDGLVAGVEDGILVRGDRSWSIDMQRFNFQFTGQTFHRIQGRAGRPGCSATSPTRAARRTSGPGWPRVGGPSTWSLQGALNCGKGQPGQAAPVSHGCPAVVVSQVTVLNTEQEGAMSVAQTAAPARDGARVEQVVDAALAAGGAARGRRRRRRRAAAATPPTCAGPPTS